MALKINKEYIVLGARLSFPHLFKTHKASDESKPRYGATLLLDKKECAKQIAEIEALIASIEKEAGKKVKPDRCAFGLGGEKNEKFFSNDEYVIVCNNQEDSPPLCVDRDKKRITAADNKLYGGCYVNATVRFWWQDAPKYGPPRINCSIEIVQRLRDGERFGPPSADVSKLPDLDADGEDPLA